MWVFDPPIEQITKKIVEAFHPRRIVLFGSRGRGDHKSDSDVDLLIEMESELPPRQRAMQVDLLFRDRHWPMDVVVYTPEEADRLRHSLNSLVGIAEREGKVLYERRR